MNFWKSSLAKQALNVFLFRLQVHPLYLRTTKSARRDFESLFHHYPNAILITLEKPLLFLFDISAIDRDGLLIWSKYFISSVSYVCCRVDSLKYFQIILNDFLDLII